MEKRHRRPVSRKPVGSGESPGLGSGDFSLTLDPSSTLPSPYANAYRVSGTPDPYATPSPPPADTSRSPFNDYTGDRFFESVQSFPPQASQPTAQPPAVHDLRQTPRLYGHGSDRGKLDDELDMDQPFRFGEPVQHPHHTAEDLDNIYSSFHFSQSSFGTEELQSPLEPAPETADPPSHGDGLGHHRMPSGDVYPLQISRHQAETFDIYDSYGDEHDVEVRIEQATAIRMPEPDLSSSSQASTRMLRDVSSGSIAAHSTHSGSGSANAPSAASISQFSNSSRPRTPRSARSPQSPRSPLTPGQVSPVMPETKSPADEDAGDERSLGFGTGSVYVKYLRSSAGRAFSDKLPSRLPIGVNPKKQVYNIPKDLLREYQNIRYTQLQPRMLAAEMDDDGDDNSVGAVGTPTSNSTVPLIPQGPDSRRSSSSTSVVEEIGRIKLFVANPDSDDD